MFNNKGESKMFNKEKKEVWLIIERHDYSNVSASYRVAKVAYSLDDAVAFKVSLEQLNESSNESYFIATDASTTMNKVITLHNEKVANDNK
jgi:hypothetical protein